MTDLSGPIRCIRKNGLIINKDYEAFLNRVQLDAFEPVWGYNSGETVKKIRPRSVVRLTLACNQKPRRFYLKRHNREFIGFRRLLALFFHRTGLSQGVLEYENICDFRKTGIPTVSPAIAGERRAGCFRVESFLMTEDFDPYVSLESLLEKTPDFFKGREGEIRKKCLITGVAALARKMHRSGFNHRDFNATHILLNYQSGSDIAELALFDLQRVEKNRWFRLRWKIKSLARLNYSLPAGVFSGEDRLNLLLSYNGKSTPGIMDRLQWYWIEKKTARIKRHTEKRQNGKG